MLRGFFELEYPDPQEMQWKFSRFYFALAYLDRYAEEFAARDARAIANTDKFALSKHVWIAMFRFFLHRNLAAVRPHGD